MPAAWELHEGVSIPLPFALCGDLLLRRLHSELPGDMLRAYADDLALVAKDVFGSARIFVPLFPEFADISGLSLNLSKTVFMPLGDDSADNLRSNLEELFL